MQQLFELCALACFWKQQHIWKIFGQKCTTVKLGAVLGWCAIVDCCWALVRTLCRWAGARRPVKCASSETSSVVSKHRSCQDVTLWTLAYNSLIMVRSSQKYLLLEKYLMTILLWKIFCSSTNNEMIWQMSNLFHVILCTLLFCNIYLRCLTKKGPERNLQSLPNSVRNNIL